MLDSLEETFADMIRDYDRRYAKQWNEDLRRSLAFWSRSLAEPAASEPVKIPLVLRPPADRK